MKFPIGKKKEFRPDREGTGQLNKLWPTPSQQLRALRWLLFTAVCLVGLLAQDVLLYRVSIAGGCTDVVPCIILMVVVLQGAESGSVFALVVGLVCDLLIFGPFDGFFTIIFVLIGILSALISENLFSPGWLCGLVVSLLGLGLTLAARLALLLLAGELRPLLMVPQALIECAISLPAIFAALPLYDHIHRRCAVDY